MTAGHPFDAPLATWIAAEAGVTGARVTRALSGGNANLTLLLDTDDGPLVLRTPPENAISATSHRGIEREATVLRAIQGHVKAPRVVGWCEDVSVIGRPFLLVSHVNGVAITDTLPEPYPATAASVNRLGEDLIDELAAIHTAPWQTIGLERFGNPENFLQRQITRWRTARAEAPVRELPLLDELADWLLQHIPVSGPVGLVHGDYHLDNTLSHPDRPGLAAVIDWELATIGDPLADLGLFLMFWGPRELDPPGFSHIQAVSRREGVLSRRVLAERWGAATGYPLANLDFYLCFAFWRLAAIVEGAYALYCEGKVDSAYARGLEYDVPALLQEAAAAARGDW
jgi:aminoglycoside phosphotransferase (APT) family kinase protein|tara:strand:- start:28326 stop:29351 length:1026 start_codon:yes stop_codon:yes gene_type:complete